MSSYIDSIDGLESIINDPATTHTLENFVLAKSLTTLSYNKFCYIDNRESCSIPVVIGIRDYINEIREYAVKITLTNIEFQKYKYNPKRLAYDIYGSTELHFIIMMLNKICNIKEFNMQTILLLKKKDMNNLLSRVYSTEKPLIEEYNNNH